MPTTIKEALESIGQQIADGKTVLATRSVYALIAYLEAEKEKTATWKLVDANGKVFHETVIEPTYDMVEFLFKEHTRLSSHQEDGPKPTSFLRSIEELFKAEAVLRAERDAAREEVKRLQKAMKQSRKCVFCGAYGSALDIIDAALAGKEEKCE